MDRSTLEVFFIIGPQTRYNYTFTPSSYLDKEAGKLRFKEMVRNCLF